MNEASFPCTDGENLRENIAFIHEDRRFLDNSCGPDNSGGKTRISADLPRQQKVGLAVSTNPARLRSLESARRLMPTW